MSNTVLKNKISALPNQPGVYQYLNKSGKIIYVGKARNLKKRVSSYFTKNHDSAKTAILVRNIADLNYVIVETEIDALILENSLIKKYQPRYNVLLKDDKSFPWICVRKERFPRVFSTRQVRKDGSKYFGPYTSVKVMNTLLDLIRQIYPLRNCNYNLSESNVKNGKFKVCLEYHIGNCLGPCVGEQQQDEYDADIDAIKQILRGNIGQVIRTLKDHMQMASENLDFELAQSFKDKLEILQRFQAKSTVVSPSINNVEIYSIVSDLTAGYVNYLRVVNGAIVQAHTLELKKKLDESEEELLALAIIEMQQRLETHAREIVVPFELAIKLDVVQTIPQRGDKKKLLELSQCNAKMFRLERHKQEAVSYPERTANRLMETIKKDLRLSEMPAHIECFDNSNIQGHEPVAACVVFKNAKPSKKDYRHFNIKTVVGPDDFASMQEVVYRRYKRLLDENQQLPQLIIIDGGKGQLSSAVKSLEELGLVGKIAIIGIAKKLEEIYFPGDSIPLYIDKKSESLKVIQQLRNEAHRFSIEHHRKKRSKSAISSQLTAIPGIGEKTYMQLIKKFKSIKRIKQASEQELSAVVGDTKAKVIKDGLAKQPT